MNWIVNSNSNTYFEFDILNGFKINAFFPKDIYKKLITGFNICWKSDHTFKPIDFLSCINNSIPSSINATEPIRPTDILRYMQRIDDAEKQYFVRFLPHTLKSCTLGNLEKTRLLLGENAYYTCKKHNISSCWSDISSDDNYDNWKNKLNEIAD